MRITTRTVIQFVAVCLICGIGVCCHKTAAKNLNDLTERGRYTEDFLARQLSHPFPFGGSSLSDQSNFMQKLYLPAIQRARQSVIRMERGELDIIPISAFVRPLEDSGVLIPMMWLQREDGERTVVLRDTNGVFVSFKVPTLQSDYRTNKSSYVRLDCVILTPPGTGPMPHPGANDFPMVRVQRPFDLRSVRISISKDGLSEETMDAPSLPIGVDIEVPTTQAGS